MSLACVECGEPAMVTKPTATGPDTSIDELVCPSCAERRDNYEPPDEDGDLSLRFAWKEFYAALSEYRAYRRRCAEHVDEIRRSRRRIQLLRELLAVDGKHVELPHELNGDRTSKNCCN